MSTIRSSRYDENEAKLWERYGRHDDLHEEAYKLITPTLQKTYGPIRYQAIDVIRALEDAGLKLVRASEPITDDARRTGERDVHH